MRIACAQFAPTHGDIARNLDAMRRCVIEAKGADLIVFPELATTGYFFMEREQLVPLAQGIHGWASEGIAALAREHEVAIATGFMEEAGGVFYNSALLFDRTGAVVGHYRKAHLFYKEKLVFERGDLGFPVFDLEIKEGRVRVGLMVCYDWRFPEAARALALAGADVIAVPSNIVTTTGLLHTVLRTRAFENKVILAFADRVGEETVDGETLLFRGESAIVYFNGEILAQASATDWEVIEADVDPERTRSRSITPYNDLFTDRLPGGYGL